MAQTVSRRPLTVESRVRSKVILCEISGELGGIGTGFSTSQYHSTTAIYSFHHLSLMLYSEQQTVSLNNTLHRQTHMWRVLLGIKTTLYTVLISSLFFKGGNSKYFFLICVADFQHPFADIRHTADTTQGSVLSPYNTQTRHDLKAQCFPLYNTYKSHHPKAQRFPTSRHTTDMSLGSVFPPLQHRHKP